jgi:hypothetical protein
MNEAKVYPIPERSLPAALEGSSLFSDMNEAQRRNYKGRLRFIEQIVLEIDEWLDGKEHDFRGFLDRIELHLAINQGAPADAETRTSSWLIHSSWALESTARKMRQELEGKLITQLDRSPPTSEVDLAQFETWLSQQNSGLRKALEGFYGAGNIDAALAHQIAIDLLVNNLLAGTVKARINPKLAP